MFRLRSDVIAFGLVFAFTGAIGQTLDAGPPRSGEYKRGTQACGPGQRETQQCAKDAAAAQDNSLQVRCEKLKDQAQRECMLEAFIQQHDRMIAGESKRE